MSVKFLILGAPRTGSTLLVKTLNTLPGIRCHGELLGPARVRGYEDGADLVNMTKQQREVREQQLLQARETDPAAFIQNALTDEAAVSGFKSIYSTFVMDRWQAVKTALLADPEFHFIHLARRNHLRRYISQEIANSGGAIHSGAGGRGEIQKKMHVDIDAFLQESAAIDKTHAEVAAMLPADKTLDITYEALAADTPAAVAEVCRFLGVEVAPAEIQPALEKVGASDLRNAVKNYQELLEHPGTREMALND